MLTILNLVLWNSVLAAAMAIVVAAACRFRAVQRRPALRQLLWMIVLLKLIMPSLAPLPVLPGKTENSPVVEDRSSTGLVAADKGMVHSEKRDSIEIKRDASEIEVAVDVSETKAAQYVWSDAWQVVFVSIGALGAIAFLLNGARQTRRLNRILVRCEATNERVGQIVAVCARRMGVSKAPAVHIVAAEVSPLLWMVRGEPVIVVPKRLAEQLSDEQLECVLCHEIAHYLRRDHWMNAFVFVVVAIYWWNRKRSFWRVIANSLLEV